MRKNLHVILLACAALASCAQPKDSVSAFQLVTAKDGRLVRLNVQNGQVFLVGEKGLIPLSDETPVLEVGAYYEMADAKDKAKFLKYLGNAQFEKSEWSIRKVQE
jgi:hypothetical protein